MDSPSTEPSTKPPSRARRSCLRRLAETLGAVAIALVAAEIGARLFLRLPPRPPADGLNMKQPVPESQAPGMTACLRPGASNTFTYRASDGTDRAIEYRINADGFRDRAYPKTAEPGTYRIAMLGDSVTFGVGIGLPETLPKQLEKLFHDRLGDVGRVEVLNCGVYSFNTIQQVAHLRYRVLGHHPDLVVIVSTVTDASGDGIRAEGYAEEKGWEARWIRRLGLSSGRWDPDEAPVLDANQRWMLRLRNRSALADFTANRTYSYLRGRVMEASYTADWRPGSPGHAAVGGALGAARRICDNNGIDLLVCMYPALTELDDYPLAGVHAELGRIAGGNDIPFVDLLPPLEGLEARALHAHAHDKHPSGAANRLVAEFLYPELERRARAAF